MIGDITVVGGETTVNGEDFVLTLPIKLILLAGMMKLPWEFIL
jgi:hypothetical protein